jgi:putative toxin-antitoxin system antitoxin component (TIGR02293 family)
MASRKSRKKSAPVTSARRSPKGSDRHSESGPLIGGSDLRARSKHVGELTLHASSGRITGSKHSERIAQRINQVREGLPISELNTLANVLRISRDQLAANLGVTTRTLQRKAEADDRLSPVASDRLARMERILFLATEVLGSSEKAARWMTAASRPLEGQLPLQLLDTDIGTQRVEQELYQIKYGIPA